MIAADTSVLIDYFKGIESLETKKVDELLNYHALVLPPVVLSELLSDPNLPNEFIQYLSELPILEIHDNYWNRAGVNRAKLIKKKLKARLADTLIAQSCIDHHIPLITSDDDFKHFNKYCGLELF
jgi:hypothetical protein